MRVRCANNQEVDVPQSVVDASSFLQGFVDVEDNEVVPLPDVPCAAALTSLVALTELTPEQVLTDVAGPDYLRATATAHYLGCEEAVTAAYEVMHKAALKDIRGFAAWLLPGQPFDAATLRRELLAHPEVFTTLPAHRWSPLAKLGADPLVGDPEFQPFEFATAADADAAGLTPGFEMIPVDVNDVYAHAVPADVRAALAEEDALRGGAFRRAMRAVAKKRARTTFASHCRMKRQRAVRAVEKCRAGVMTRRDALESATWATQSNRNARRELRAADTPPERRDALLRAWMDLKSNDPLPDVGTVVQRIDEKYERLERREAKARDALREEEAALAEAKIALDAVNLWICRAAASTQGEWMMPLATVEQRRALVVVAGMRAAGVAASWRLVQEVLAMARRAWVGDHIQLPHHRDVRCDIEDCKNGRVHDSTGAKQSGPAPAKVIQVLYQGSDDMATVNGEPVVWEYKHNLNARALVTAHFGAMVSELDQELGGLGGVRQVCRCGFHAGGKSADLPGRDGQRVGVYKCAGALGAGDLGWSLPYQVKRRIEFEDRRALKK